MRHPLPSLLALSSLTLAPIFISPPSPACTSFLVTKGASADDATMITYAADSHSLYGELYFHPGGKHPKGSKREIRDWDSGKVLGEIPQVEETFRVVGNMNEHQVVIGETTYGGREDLAKQEGKIDYGSMIYVALERAKTAREAIQIMVSLANEHGYASEGESFSIGDPNEAWIMDLIGKGPGEKGVVWVACQVPDGHVSAHANLSRIQTFPRTGPQACLYAEDVVSFARKKGIYSGTDEEFSFQKVYSPAPCKDLRVCEARVWSFFRRVAPSLKLPIDYAVCNAEAKPYPLWIKPDKKLTVKDLTSAMRDHFEDSPLDLSKGVGAGPYGLPYRWRPLTWEVDGKSYLNERSTATQQTGFSFVSQSRAHLSPEVGGLLWFSVDDTASTVYVPMYAGLTKIPKAYAVGTGAFDRFSWDAAFWVFNWVSNFTYLRYQDIIKDVQAEQQKLEDAFHREQREFEAKTDAVCKKSRTECQKLVTSYSDASSTKVMSRWTLLGQELLMKYMDGNVRNAQGKAEHPGYSKEWYAQVAKESGHDLPDPPKAANSAAGVPSSIPSASPASSSPNPGSQPTSNGCSAAPSSNPTHAAWILLLAATVGAVGASRRRRVSCP